MRGCKERWKEAGLEAGRQRSGCSTAARTEVVEYWCVLSSKTGQRTNDRKRRKEKKKREEKKKKEEVKNDTLCDTWYACEQVEK